MIRKNKVLIEQFGILQENQRISRFDKDGKAPTCEQIAVAMENAAEELHGKLKNDNAGLSAEDLADFQALSTIDIETQASQMPDNIADRLVHDGMPRRELMRANGQVSDTVLLKDFIDAVGYFEPISGTNDKVPMMTTLESSETVKLVLSGLGYKDTLRNLLANTLDNPAGVNRSFARALVIEKNREVLAPILKAGYTGNTVAAVTGGTFLENLYATLFKAVSKVMGNTYTVASGKLTARVGDLSGRTIILLPTGIAELTKMRDRDTTRLTVSEALAGTEIIGVSQPMVAPFGAKSAPTSLYTLPANKGYVIRLPDSMESHLRIAPVDVLSKTGQGSVLAGGSTEIAHFRYSGVFNKFLLPNGAGKGCIIEVNLPDPTL